MKLLIALLYLALAFPAHAGRPKACGDDKPAEPPPNPTPVAVKKHSRDGGLSFAEGAAIVITIGLVCNLVEGCKLKGE